ncbi:MAG: hypothetical protein KAV82_11415 [Phycisphaerae bacterium]|nr:hypothetical protein [Phycisphaerae bacterium]
MPGIGVVAFAPLEHERPNDLWQMDFKGHFAMERGRCFENLTACQDSFDDWRGPVFALSSVQITLQGSGEWIYLCDSGLSWGLGAFAQVDRRFELNQGLLDSAERRGSAGADRTAGS